ncbi:MAG TPA: hypothetical protein VHA12_01350 [Candidatus Nanoarchaeia archaeon]|nr:hypothetical protein [Candidatus Nanoarchaeia archaeon]
MTIKKTSNPASSIRKSYKQELANAYQENSAFLSTLNSSMQSRLDRIYSAFSGNYSYIDSHTGKKVNARTYKKRLSFVEKEIQVLRQHLALQYKYGLFSEEKKAGIENYISSLYSAAINKNDYLKDKYVRRSVISQEVRDSIHSLGPSIEDKLSIDENSKFMRAPTRYTEMFKDKERTLSDDVKLSDNDLPAWPFSREEEIELREKMNPAAKPKRKGFFKVALGVAALVLGGITSLYNTNFVFSPKLAQDYSHIDPNRVAEPIVDYSKINPNLEAQPIQYVDKPTLDYEAKLREQGKLTPLKEIAEKDVIEEAKRRVIEAKKQISLEKSKAVSQYTPEQLKQRSELAWKKVRQYESEIAQQNERDRKNKEALTARITSTEVNMKGHFDWKKSFDAYWQRKSDARARENIVVKVATFHDGKVDVSFPLNGNSYAYSVNIN